LHPTSSSVSKNNSKFDPILALNFLSPAFYLTEDHCNEHDEPQNQPTVKSARALSLSGSLCHVWLGTCSFRLETSCSSFCLFLRVYYWVWREAHFSIFMRCLPSGLLCEFLHVYTDRITKRKSAQCSACHSTHTTAFTHTCTNTYTTHMHARTRTHARPHTMQKAESESLQALLRIFSTHTHIHTHAHTHPLSLSLPPRARTRTHERSHTHARLHTPRTTLLNILSSKLYVAVCCRVLQCFITCCSVVQCVAVCCSVL